MPLIYAKILPNQSHSYFEIADETHKLSMVYKPICRIFEAEDTKGRIETYTSKYNQTSYSVSGIKLLISDSKLSKEMAMPMTALSGDEVRLIDVYRKDCSNPMICFPKERDVVNEGFKSVLTRNVGKFLYILY